MSEKTLSSSDDVGHRNNLTIMRLIAAIAVIWGHSFALTQRQGLQDPVAVFFGGQRYSGTIAVHIFFVISGFLVTRSMMTARSLFDFGLARILRIFPALIVCNVLMMLAVGLFASDLSFVAYLTDPLMEAYLIKNTLLTQLPSYNLSGAFGNLPYQSVNGSLWTLPGEIRRYVFLAGLLLVWPLIRMLGVEARVYFGLGMVA